MIALSKEIRRLLDQNGLQDVKIFVSSDFDEFKIQHVLKRGAQIDAFGVGTKVGVSADAPYLHIVYKMVRLNKQNVRKLSTGKITLAGKKQVFRKKNDQGQYEEDTIGTRDEKIENAQPLLEKVMKNGQITCPSPSLNTIRENCRQNCLALDDRYKDIDSPAPYPVLLSKEIKEIQPR
jgi:nicotinate phosphoribosyltransferase